VNIYKQSQWKNI